jgi:two-component system KDP operon response regulator KdpE
MSSGRILVVDDDPQIRRVLRTALIAQGYEIDDVRSGKEALERVREERFDLVLLDMNMPGIGGIETCRTLRAGCNAAIIMLTVRDSEQDKVRALDAGADAFLLKPVSPRALATALLAATRPSAAAI